MVRFSSSSSGLLSKGSAGKFVYDQLGHSIVCSGWWTLLSQLQSRLLLHHTGLYNATVGKIPTQHSGCWWGNQFHFYSFSHNKTTIFGHPIGTAFLVMDTWTQFQHLAPKDVVQSGPYCCGTTCRTRTIWDSLARSWTLSNCVDNVFTMYIIYYIWDLPIK